MNKIQFPAPTGTIINMMPIIMGDHHTVPRSLAGYRWLIDACDLPLHSTVYLTVHESLVLKDTTQRRPGVHTDGTCAGQWGGGSWGEGGIFLASTDGDTAIWDTEVEASDVDAHGALKIAVPGTPRRTLPGVMYRITDRTPHASIPARHTHYRQFFRLVGPDVHAWYAKHSTASPFGVMPKCPIITESKFEENHV